MQRRPKFKSLRANVYHNEAVVVFPKHLPWIAWHILGKITNKTNKIGAQVSSIAAHWIAGWYDNGFICFACFVR